MTDDKHFNMDQFDGLAPVFPVTDAILFPHLAISLEVSGLEQLSVLEYALEHNRIIGLALALPNDESETPDHSDLLFSMACLGVVLRVEKTKNDRYSIFVLGLSRAEITQELQEQPFRIAQFRIPEHPEDEETDEFTENIRNEILEQVSILSEYSPTLKKHIRTLNKYQLSLGCFVDLLACFCSLTLIEQQFVLQKTDILSRAIRMKHLLATLIQREKNKSYFPYQEIIPSLN